MTILSEYPLTDLVEYEATGEFSITTAIDWTVGGLIVGVFIASDISFVRANGKTSRKVFQISERTYNSGRHMIKRRHSFADMSTRKHYPGVHDLAIVVNGVEKSRTTVKLNRGVSRGS